jgi:hypothetical protein
MKGVVVAPSEQEHEMAVKSPSPHLFMIYYSCWMTWVTNAQLMPCV